METHVSTDEHKKQKLIKNAHCEVSQKDVTSKSRR